jgi:uncharacterized repeat protein (TIGR01451 family)
LCQRYAQLCRCTLAENAINYFNLNLAKIVYGFMMFKKVQFFFENIICQLRPSKWALMAIISASASLIPITPAAAQITQYTNTTSGAINDLTCGTAGIVSRNFTVGTNFIVGDVDLGVLLSHTYRSDLRITLRSPIGTVVNVMLNTAGDGDNLNDLFNDEAATAITTHTTGVTDPLTPAPPPYSHSFRPSSALSAFDGQNAIGTWTMEICDSVGADVGTFTRADLYLTRSPTLVIDKSNSIISDPTNGTTNPKYIPGAVVQYCILVTNAGIVPATTVNILDSIPSETTYVLGSITSATSCASIGTAEDDDATGSDESDPYGGRVTGIIVAGSSATLAPGGTFAIKFNAKVN